MAHKLLIGNSLSGCVRDILNGKVTLDQVVCIIAGTNYSSWVYAFDNHWSTSLHRDFPLRHDEVRDLYHALWPRMVQPRKWHVDPNISGTERWIEANVKDANHPPTEEEIAEGTRLELERQELVGKARELWSDSTDDIEIYDDAKVSRGGDDRGTWVEGYLWVPDPDSEDNEE